MKSDYGSMEGILSGAGVAVAASIVMLVVLVLFRSTLPADAAIAIQSAADEICGDIGTVAVSSIPIARDDIRPAEGITVNISSDYVVTRDLQGLEFARPLTVRVYPGNYHGAGGVDWNDTAEMREYLNATFGERGTRDFPLSAENRSLASTLLESAGLDLVSHPVCIDWSMPLTVEKLFIFVHNASNGITESDSYVFVYR